MSTKEEFIETRKTAVTLYALLGELEEKIDDIPDPEDLVEDLIFTLREIELMESKNVLIPTVETLVRRREEKKLARKRLKSTDKPVVYFKEFKEGSKGKRFFEVEEDLTRIAKQLMLSKDELPVTDNEIFEWMNSLDIKKLNYALECIR